MGDLVQTYRDIVERNADQMERECKHPPCQHAAGMRLALSYLDDAVVLAREDECDCPFFPCPNCGYNPPRSGSSGP